MASQTSMPRNQAIRFHDHLVYIETVVLNGIECLCLEDVQRRFPSVTTLSADNIQLAFLRDDQGNYLIPLRIKASIDRTIDAIEPTGKSNDTVSTLFDQIDFKIRQMDKKTDLILANTQETLVRLKHVMTQMYELHEYTTPRYFFILPVKNHQWTSINNVQNWFLFHYKLYFLCECSNEPDKLHMAPHDGYSIKKPGEFVANYGSYLRTTMSIARSVLSVSGIVLPQTDTISMTVGSTIPQLAKESTTYTDVNDKLDLVERMLNQMNQDLVQVDASSMRNVALPNVPLQGAQLRELEVFLEHVDTTHSLGNLYRTITDDGHVRWVCLEHYNKISFNNKLCEYIRQCQSMGGKYNSTTKELHLTGSLTTKNIETISQALTKGFSVLILILENCSLEAQDLNQLFDAVINRSSIHRLVLKSVEISKWKGMSKYICDSMMISLKNQSLKVQYSRGQEGAGTRVLIRLLKQNKICRSIDFFGSDLSVEDKELFSQLKGYSEITNLTIHQPVAVDILFETVKNFSSLQRLKLTFSLNSSSSLINLCRVLETNQTLIELDIIDNIFTDGTTGLIELLKIIQRHKSIKSLRLHVSDVKTSNRKETSLIGALLHDDYISHLRISDSVISSELTQALTHACQERGALIHLEFYNCQLRDDDLSSLQLAHASENLTHLSVSHHTFWSRALIENRQKLKNEFPPHKNAELEEKLAQYVDPSSICLDEMTLIDQDIEIVVQQVLLNKPCQLLSLQSNKLTFLGISILADGLINNTTLETLYLGDNHLTDDAVRCLVETLENKNQTLKTLVLQKNQITDQGVKYLAQMLQSNSTLLWLYLGENQISDEGIRFLFGVIANGKTNLEMLVLSSNKFITDKSVEYFLSMIKINQTMKKLWIENCALSDKGKKALLDVQQKKKDFYVCL